MFRGPQWKNPVTLALLAAGLIVGASSCLAADELAANTPSVDSGLYVKVLLPKAVKMSKLKPGDVVDGSLSRDVYAADRKVFSTGSRVQLRVDHLEKRKRTPNDHWPWVVKAFTPRHENYPVFKSAAVVQGGDETSLQVSVISVSRTRDVQARSKKNKSGEQSSEEHGAVGVSHSNARRPATATMVLEAFGVDSTPAAADHNSEPSLAEPDSAMPATLPAGTHCRILLLGNVSASRSNPGDVVQARLLEPVLLNSTVVLPAGSLFEGRVVKKTPPRWLSRAGSLYLTFSAVTLPAGSRLPIAASLAGAELDANSHTRMDAEGRLRGERPGKAWMAINLGMSAGLSKEIDDGVQLVIEAIVSAATDASTAGTARIVSSCVSGLYMATRHGRDVVLPRFTEMDISLDRPVSLNPPAQIASSAVAGGK